MNRLTSRAAAALLACAPLLASADPSITNGSFEAQVRTPGTRYTGAITGWIKTFNGPLALVSGNIIDNGGNYYGVTPFGSNYVGLDPITTGFQAGISQIVAGFVAGQTYALTVYAADSDGGLAPKLDIFFSDGGSTVYQDNVYNLPVGGPYGDVIQFQQIVTYFTAPVSGSIAISIFNAGSAYVTNDPGSISIDNVSIAAVPELGTATSTLLGLGAMGLLLGRRRQRAAAGTTA